MSNVSTASIKVGDRLREDLGDLGDLMASIQQHGLLHPIVVDDKRNLVAGQRRLEAFKLLGKKQISVTFYGDLSEDERTALELEENVRRKDLTAYEKSKLTKKRAEDAKLEVLGETPKTNEEKEKGGRPTKGKASQEEAAERLGLDQKSVSNAERHVDAGERYPFLQGAAWSQQAALKAAKLMGTMTVPDQRKIATIVTESGAPPSDAVNMIESFSRAKPDVKKKAYEMFGSKDFRDRQLATTYLAKTAPIPDPRAVYLFKVSKQLNTQASTFRKDAFNDRIGSLATRAKALAGQIMAHQKKKAKGLSR